MRHSAKNASGVSTDTGGTGGSSSDLRVASTCTRQER